MSIHRLIYCSRAAKTQEPQSLDDILAEAETKNRRDGITGFLCFGNGWFLQVVEGERSALSRLYARICRDDRHGGLDIIGFSEAEHRSFHDWSMNYMTIDLGKATISIVLQKFSGTLDFRPELMSASQCLGFMEALSRL